MKRYSLWQEKQWDWCENGNTGWYRQVGVKLRKIYYKGYQRVLELYYSHFPQVYWQLGLLLSYERTK